MARKTESSKGKLSRPNPPLLRASETRAVVYVTPPDPRYHDPFQVITDRDSVHWKAVENARAWDDCVDPILMLPHLGEWSSPRKLRLLACGIVRHAPFGQDGRTIWELVPDYSWFLILTRDGSPVDCHELVEVAEQWAGVLIEEGEWMRLRNAGGSIKWAAEADTFGYRPEVAPGSLFRYMAASAMENILHEDDRLLEWMVSYRRYAQHDEAHSLHPSHGATVCRLIDDLYGNPFRPAIVRRDWVSETASDLAQTIYKDRAFHLMPVLGDALEESGCFDGEILRHCRGSGPHARGCWVVDQVSKREWLPPYRPRKNPPGLKRR